MTDTSSPIRKVSPTRRVKVNIVHASQALCRGLLGQVFGRAGVCQTSHDRTRGQPSPPEAS
jgi:hypothetical protein